MAFQRYSMEKEHDVGSSSWIVRAKEHLEHQHIHRRPASAITLHEACACVIRSERPCSNVYKMDEPQM